MGSRARCCRSSKAPRPVLLKRVPENVPGPCPLFVCQVWSLRGEQEPRAVRLGLSPVAPGLPTCSGLGLVMLLG